MVRATTVRRYAFALIATALAAAGRFALEPLWGTTGRPFILFFPVLVVVAWLGGAGPGLLATALTAVVASVFARDPWTPANLVELVIFIGIGGATSALHEALKRARERETSARERAEQMQRAREHLMTIVAHDLRSPLTAISLNAEAASRYAARPETVASRCAAIVRTVSGMQSLITDLLDAAKIEGGHLAITLGAVDTNALVAEALEPLRDQAETRGVELRSDISAAPLVRADRSRLLQVLGNVLGNALKFTERGGSVVVRIRHDDRCVTFEIADSGEGIAPETLPRVFERHFTSGRGGTGLGLYTARGIVEAHGGRIDVKSTIGKGTTVTFTVPRDDARSDASASWVDIGERGSRGPYAKPSQREMRKASCDERPQRRDSKTHESEER